MRLAAIVMATAALVAVGSAMLAPIQADAAAKTVAAHSAADDARLHNVTPQPWFFEACSEQGGNSPACIGQAVRAIDHARAREHLRKARLVLPDNFRRLTRAQQVFVVLNLERVDRGLRPVQGMVGALDAVARTSAAVEIDPSPVTGLLQALGIERYRSVWARGYGVLAADYEWMYDDGYSADGASNIDCRYAGDAGCWAHRRAILASFSGRPRLLAGAGAALGPRGADSVTAILAGGYGPVPRFTFTWREALRHGANGHR